MRKTGRKSFDPVDENTIVGPVTIREVAADADVSIATVSRALQSPSLLKSETLAKVKEAIHRLGYIPNAQARNMRTSQSYLIIALVPDIGNPFFSQVVRGIERAVQQQGYSVLLGDTQYDDWREKQYYQLIRSKQADGIITLLPNIPDEMLSIKNPPIVNACECVDHPNITTVSVDNRGGAFAATQYLISLGHKDIAFIRGRSNSPLTTQREQGYRNALHAANLSVDPQLIVDGDFSPGSGIWAISQLLGRNRRFTAVFSCNDEMAFGAVSGLRNAGLSVPDDVSVVGFDDILFCRFFGPALTTVAQPMLEMGMEAGRLLLEILTKKTVTSQKRVFPASLVIRDSTMPPPP